MNIHNKNAGISSKTVSELEQSAGKPVNEEVAPSEAIQGELEAHWDWAAIDIDVPPMTRPKGESLTQQPRVVTEH